MPCPRLLALALAASLAPGCFSPTGVSSRPDASAPDARDAGADAGSPPDAGPRGECSPDGWCWELPRPHGNAFSSLYLASGSAPWALDRSGRVKRFDGQAWVDAPLQPQGQVSTLVGTSASDVWALGSTAWHWDGTSWTLTPTPPAPLEECDSPAWALAPDDVWMAQCGEADRLLHWDGATWTAQGIDGYADPRIVAIGGDSTNLWAVGTRDLMPLLLRFAEGGWVDHRDEAHHFGLRPLGLAVFGAEVWVSANARTWPSPQCNVYRRTGPYRWELVAELAESCGPLAGTSSDDLWHFGSTSFGHWDGSTWTSTPAPGGVAALTARASSPSDVWAAGGGATSWHWDGRAWTTHAPAALLTGGHPPILRCGQEAWAISSNRVLRRTGGGWVLDRELFERFTDLVAVPTAAGDEVWALADSTLWHRSAGGWRTPAERSSVPLFALWAATPDALWAAGEQGTLARFDRAAARWAPASTGTSDTFRWIRGFGPDYAWAGGDGALLQFDGAAWTQRLPADSGAGVSPDSFWAAAADDVWIGSSAYVSGTGYEHTLLRWDGTQLRTVERGAGRIAALTGFGPNDVWMALVEDWRKSALRHWDGSGWTTVALVDVALEQLAGPSSTDLFALGASDPFVRLVSPHDYAYRWDGTSLRRADLGTRVRFFGIGSCPGLGTFALGTGSPGDNPTVLHHP